MLKAMHEMRSDSSSSHEDHDHHHHHQVPLLSKRQMFLIIAFCVFYMVSAVTLDSFDLYEALRYILNGDLSALPAHLVGFVTSFIANLPVLAVIGACWVKGMMHSHEGHHHSKLQTLIELLAIGGPFSMVGVAAYLETFEELFTDIKNLSVMAQVFAYLGAAGSGLLTGAGAFKLHSYHAHKSSVEHGGFFRGLYATFVTNVLDARKAHPTLGRKILAVLDNFGTKASILIAHAFLGVFATKAFFERTGLGERTPEWAQSLSTATLATLVTMFEGLTEAMSVDDYSRKNKEYPMFIKIWTMLASVFHMLPSTTALSSSILKDNVSGPLAGKFYNILTYVASILVIAPSAKGTYTMIIGPTYKEGRKLLNCCPKPRVDYDSIESVEEEIIEVSDEDSTQDDEYKKASFCCKGLPSFSLFGFFKKEKQAITYANYGMDNAMNHG